MRRRPVQFRPTLNAECLPHLLKLLLQLKPRRRELPRVLVGDGGGDARGALACQQRSQQLVNSPTFPATLPAAVALAAAAAGLILPLALGAEASGGGKQPRARPLGHGASSEPLRAVRGTSSRMAW
jgi:hypothetical protein